MDTDTVNPQAPAHGDHHSELPFGHEHGDLRRSFQDRMLTGTAAGLARYFGVDVTLVRIAFVVLTLIGGAGIPLYLAGFLLIPEEGSSQSIAASLIESFRSR
jgi:phage shock protein PspC (stress-responsive transcriptional regulator)